LDLLE
jgi:hypothetical protein